MLKRKEPCPRPSNIEDSEIITILERRGLSAEGSRSELDELYLQSDLSNYCLLSYITDWFDGMLKVLMCL